MENEIMPNETITFEEKIDEIIPLDDILSFEEIHTAGTVFLGRLKDYFIAYIPTLLVALTLLAVGLILNKLIIMIFSRGLRKSPIDRSAHAFLASIVKALLYLIVFVTVLAVLGIPINSLIAVIGSAGLAIGLAMQNSLSNVAGGIILLIGKPFKVGDFIDVNGTAGTVTEISVICIKLITQDNKVVYLPNSSVSGGTITNFTEMPTRRVELTFRIDSGSSYKKTMEIVRLAAVNHPKVIKKPEPFVRVNAVTMRSVEIIVRFWVNSIDFTEVQHDILEIAADRFTE